MLVISLLNFITFSEDDSDVYLLNVIGARCNLRNPVEVSSFYIASWKYCFLMFKSGNRLSGTKILTSSIYSHYISQQGYGKIKVIKLF